MKIPHTQCVRVCVGVGVAALQQPLQHTINKRLTRLQGKNENAQTTANENLCAEMRVN